MPDITAWELAVVVAGAVVTLERIIHIVSRVRHNGYVSEQVFSDRMQSVEARIENLTKIVIGYALGKPAIARDDEGVA